MPVSNIHHNMGRTVRHSELHNLYGYYVHEATFNGLLLRNSTAQLRPFVLSRSFFAGTQRYGAIWTGDNTANWEHLAISVPMLLSLSVSGLPFVGADVGGFFNNPSGELMARWYEAAAYTPFFRNHAHQDTDRRELWQFEDRFAQRMKHSILARYRILPYLYTLFFLSSSPAYSVLIMRPLWFGDFKHDSSAYGREDAFMLGDAFYVQPIVTEAQSEVDVTLPQNAQGDALFYSMYGAQLQIYSAGSHHLVGYEARIPVLRYGGTVTVEKHRIRRSASLMRFDPVTVVIALDAKGCAQGMHYMDDETTLNGEHILSKLEFCLDNKRLTNRIVQQSERRGSVAEVEVERIVLMGADIDKQSFTEIHIQQGTNSRKSRQFGFADKTMAIRLPQIVLNEPFTVTLS